MTRPGMEALVPSAELVVRQGTHLQEACARRHARGRLLGGYIQLGGFQFTRELPGCPHPGCHVHAERTVFRARWPPDADLLRVARELGVPVGPVLLFVMEDGRGARRLLVRGRP